MAANKLHIDTNATEHHAGRRPDADAKTAPPPALTPGEFRLDLGALAADLATGGPVMAPDVPARALSGASAAFPGVGLRWDFVRDEAHLSLELRLRALLEVLRALSGIHTDVRRTPSERAHGALCHANVLFCDDGSAVLLRRAQGAEPQPRTYAAPECRLSRVADVDQQADIYAVGALLLEALTDQTLTPEDVRGLGTSGLLTHPFWGRYARDPLLMVAMCATSGKPELRHGSARSLADAIATAAQGRLGSRLQLADAIHQAVARRADRATPVVPALASRQPVAASFVGPLSRPVPPPQPPSVGTSQTLPAFGAVWPRVESK